MKGAEMLGKKFFHELVKFDKKIIVIYLAGPISPGGVKEEEYWENIRNMVYIEHTLPLELEFSGYKIKVINPATDVLAFICFGTWLVSYNGAYEMTEERLKQRNRISIELADMIYALSGWEESEGAKEEIEYARQLGKIIIYEEEEE
jgi:hypothetical protein